MGVKRVKLADLKPDQNNANRGTERGVYMLQRSLSEYGAGRSILIDRDGNIIAGNKTVEQAADLGIEEVIVVPTDGRTLVAVQREDLDLYDGDKARLLAYYDNRTSEVDLAWEAEQLLADQAAGVDLSGLWFDDELEALLAGAAEAGDSAPTQEQARLTLAERFIVPPFSVLDARQGYWQERKRAWIALGLQGELGRFGEDMASYKSQARLDALVKTGSSKIDPASLEAKQDGVLIIDAYRGKGKPGQPEINGVMGPPHDAGSATSQTGISIFDPVLCEIAYTWFTAPSSHVLDPFAGGSVRGIVAAYLGRQYTGIDLRPEQIAANEQQAAAIVPGTRPRWITGNSLWDIPAEDYDFIFSCPPYYDLEIYSDHPEDLSNYDDYAAFLADYRSIVKKAVDRLRDDRFACFVVGDIRDKGGHYRNFVSDTIAAFQDAGAALYNEAVLITAAGSLPVRVAAAFPKGRKLGKSHQNVLVFVKGDWRKAAAACGPVEVATFDPAQME